MKVPITPDELTHLISLSANGFDPKTIPLTHDSGDHGSYAIESDTIGGDAAWALAQLSVLRASPGQRVRVGGPVTHTGARDLTGGIGHLTGYHQCEDCGGAEFTCSDSAAHDGSDGDGYSFPDYGPRLDLQKIQALIMRSGLVTEYGAAQLAAWLDMEAYVLREPDTKGS